MRGAAALAAAVEPASRSVRVTRTLVAKRPSRHSSGAVSLPDTPRGSFLRGDSSLPSTPRGSNRQAGLPPEALPGDVGDPGENGAWPETEEQLLVEAVRLHGR